MSQRDPRRENVGGDQRRQLSLPNVPPGHRQGGYQPAVEYAAGLKNRKAEELAWIFQVVGHVHHEDHDLGADDAGDGAVNPQVLHLVRFETRLFRESPGDPQTG